MSAAQSGERRSIHRSRLYPDTRNPRGKVHHDDPSVVELAASMRAHGQIEPMVVRPAADPDQWIIVIGHRREVALDLAGIAEADCIVREMTDEQAYEVMLVENKQREPLPPLAEANALRVIVETAGGVQAASLRVGKSADHVRSMLSLLNLVPAVQGRLAAGQLPVEHALSIARLPKELHIEAADAVMLDDGAVLSLRDATHLIKTKFTLRLDTAPFERADFELFPEAGPCTTCPKRSGVQAELFAVVATADLCLDPKCFAEKRDRAWELRASVHESKKLPVYEGKEAKKVLDQAEYLDLEATCPRDVQARPWKAVLGKAVAKIPTVLARDEEHRVHELALRTDIAGAKLNDPARGVFEEDEKAIQAARDLELAEKNREARREKAVRHALETIVGTVESGPMSDTLAQSITEAAIEVTWPETLKMVAARMGIPKGPNVTEDLVEAVKSFPAESALGMLVELILTRVATRGEDPLGQGTALARVLAACEAPKKGGKAKAAPKAAEPAAPPPEGKEGVPGGAPPEPKAKKTSKAKAEGGKTKASKAKKGSAK